MDDVYVVIGLLSFGSLLFCLCCYKVTNLLYMLYHIDDNEADEEELAPGGIPKDTYSLVMAAAAAAANNGVTTQLEQQQRDQVSTYRVYITQIRPKRYRGGIAYVTCICMCNIPEQDSSWRLLR